MLRITGKLGFQAETMVKVRHKIDNHLPNFYFLRLLWLKYPLNEVKILTFRDRFDILMEVRLSGVAKRLKSEMSA